MDGDLVLDIKNLSIRFGGLKAVDDLSFDIKEREIYGLIGPNGAGKTTVFNCITQFYHPNEGTVLFRTNKGNVENLVGQKSHNIISKGLVRTFQNVELTKTLSIVDNVMMGAHIRFKSDLLSVALHLPNAYKEEEALRAKAEDILKSLGLYEIKDMYVAGQPYGVMKKVELARTLMSDPKLIILDEPAAGLNDSETIGLIDIIKTIRDEYDCAILLVEHDMRFVNNVCDRICAICFGKLLAIGTPEEIQKNEAVQEAYLGKADD
ncbi:MAG: ABC transporter ATP-binding protein [Clostridia bacterium]|nr:ABC transporter ATP-binding protein [Clostridia bacterium]